MEIFLHIYTCIKISIQGIYMKLFAKRTSTNFASRKILQKINQKQGYKKFKSYNLQQYVCNVCHTILLIYIYTNMGVTSIYTSTKYNSSLNYTLPVTSILYTSIKLEYTTLTVR